MACGGLVAWSAVMRLRSCCVSAAIAGGFCVLALVLWVWDTCPETIEAAAGTLAGGQERCLVFLFCEGGVWEQQAPHDCCGTHGVCETECQELGTASCSTPWFLLCLYVAAASLRPVGAPALQLVSLRTELLQHLHSRHKGSTTVERVFPPHAGYRHRL